MDNNQRQRLLTLVAILCIGALAGDKLILTPLINLWGERSERIVELEKQLTKGHLLLDRENDLKTRWENMQKSALPQDKSLAENLILKAEDRWVNDSRITRSSFKPQWKQVQEDYMTLDCRTVAQGNMESIVRFLFELEQDPLALRIEEVEIAKNDENGEKLTLEVVFSGLQLMEKQ